jgi:hypothetical protein
MSRSYRNFFGTWKNQQSNSSNNDPELVPDNEETNEPAEGTDDSRRINQQQEQTHLLPSNASSVSSRRPSTISTVQSSIFSKSGLSSSTASTSASVSSSSNGRLMKVVNLEKISEGSEVESRRGRVIRSTPESSQIRPTNTAANTTTSVQRQLTLSEEIQKLSNDLVILQNQVMNGMLTVPRAANIMIQLFNDTNQSPAFANVSKNSVSLHSEPCISKVIKVALHFVDNVLRDDQYRQSKTLLLEGLYDMGLNLKFLEPVQGPVPYPRNFAVGTLPELPAQELLVSIIDRIITSDDINISEQEGAFIAPILRGLSPEFAVLCLTFGFPMPESEHHDAVASMYNISDDIHVYCQKNYIRACGGGFKAPYRISVDDRAPPMSMSLATENAVSLSGTLGGYIYPKLAADNKNFTEYARSTFAVTCAHVCLAGSGAELYPQMCVPSPVLINYYRKALARESNKYPLRSEERSEYNKAITQIDSRYPVSQSQGFVGNKPSELFGQVVWGERKVVDGSISDIAIIKCNDNLKCRNYLGDDISFSEFDPALMFGNLYVKRIVKKLVPGMTVFKYGSTSKYTRGKLNGPRLVYWADGKIQSSEFAVQSDSSSLFASGGDSGAWILQKSEDHFLPDDDSNATPSRTADVSDQASTITSNSIAGPNLGVVGMLHSYDGERKEFGLFTSIESILDRLHQVTNIKWGVVGVPDEDNEDLPAGGSDSEYSDLGSSDGGEKE